MHKLFLHRRAFSISLYLQVSLTALLLFVCGAASSPLSSGFLQSLWGRRGSNEAGLSSVRSGNTASGNTGPAIVWLQPGESWEAIEGKPVDYDEDIFSYVPNVGIL